MSWYLSVLKDYAVFSGEASRREYWMFSLINFLIIVALVILDISLGMFDEEAGMGVISGIYILATLLPSLAVTVRRLHDTSRSGWWILLNFVPLIGPLILLVFLVQDSR